MARSSGSYPDSNRENAGSLPSVISPGDRAHLQAVVADGQQQRHRPPPAMPWTWSRSPLAIASRGRRAEGVTAGRNAVLGPDLIDRGDHAWQRRGISARAVCPSSARSLM